jgi:hypothetical protein
MLDTSLCEASLHDVYDNSGVGCAFYLRCLIVITLTADFFLTLMLVVAVEMKPGTFSTL